MTCQECLTKVWSAIAFPFSPSIGASNQPAAKDDTAWYASDFKPKEGADYTAALNYGEGRYQEARDTFATLDKKADWFYGLGIVSIAAIYLMSPQKTLLSLAYGLPSILLSAYALLSIMRAKMSSEVASPRDIRGAIERVDKTGDPAPWICASLHCATETLTITNRWKATHLKNASIALLLSFFLAPTVLLSSSCSPAAPTPRGDIGSAPEESAAPAVVAEGPPAEQENLPKSEPAELKPEPAEQWTAPPSLLSQSPDSGGLPQPNPIDTSLNLATATAVPRPLPAAVPQVLPKGFLPEDRRLEDLKDYSGYFPFEPSATPEAWSRRAEQVRRQILVAAGLWPMPTATPAKAVVHGLVDRGDYLVEKVYFQSFPGHYVTGNLYRPKGKEGRLPGVLCPHGHWAGGRFNDCGPEEIRKRIMRGEERFEAGGRSAQQARCVQLTRMGAVVFHYDMLGYADSVQIPLELAHGFASERPYPLQRPHMNTPEHWGLLSPQAELRLQNVMGIQTYNSIRALDWLSQLPDVDPARIGVTGASGGGSQTMFLLAVDPRPLVGFPAVMVSTGMQGDCTCDNCCLLRVGTGNVEFAAMTAPRALGMTGADDWTRDIMTKGFPQLKQHYEMLGAGDNVMARALVQFQHNYNFVSREVMYQWFNKHLQMRLPEPVVEEDYRRLSIAEMSVWDADHPRPTGGEDYERQLLAWMTEDAAAQMAALTPHDSQSWAKYREVVGGAVDAIVGRQLPVAGAIESAQHGSKDCGAWQEITALLRYPAEEEELPVVILRPKTWNRRTVIWLDEQGKAGLYGDDLQLVDEARKLLAAGTAIVAPDLLYQGEFLEPGRTMPEARRAKNSREYIGFTLGYNRALCAQRAHDVLSVISWLRYGEALRSDVVALLALKGTAPWAAAALAQARGAVDRAAIDTAGFRFADLNSQWDVNLLPGVVKYGDLPGLLSLAAPTRLWLAGEGCELPAIIAASYRSAGEGSVTVAAVPPDGQIAAAVEWLGE